MSETRNPVDTKPEKESPFDPFELLTALLLGLAAIGAAWAGYQNSLWGGVQADAYARSSTLATKAASLYNQQIAEINQDYSVDLEAKKIIFEALEQDTPEEKNAKFVVASNLYTRYLSEEAYKALALPSEYLVPKKGTVEVDYTEAKPIPEQILVGSLDEELDDDYINKMLAEAEEKFAESDKVFAEGGAANTNGDRFSLDTVIFTIALFFAGLGVVFKTRVRWLFLGFGSAAFLAAAAYMFSIPWA